MAQSSGGAKVSGYASFGFDRGIGAPRRLGSQYVDIVLEYGTGSKLMGVALIVLFGGHGRSITGFMA